MGWYCGIGCGWNCGIGWGHGIGMRCGWPHCGRWIGMHPTGHCCCFFPFDPLEPILCLFGVVGVM